MNDLQSKTNFELNALVAMHEHPDLSVISDNRIVELSGGAAMFKLSLTRVKRFDYVSEWGREECVKYLEDAK